MCPWDNRDDFHVDGHWRALNYKLYPRVSEWQLAHCWSYLCAVIFDWTLDKRPGWNEIKLVCLLDYYNFNVIELYTICHA